jgi:UDP-N-acetylmuramoyl-tripeptide--D-alanyl-D-alanine ligase
MSMGTLTMVAAATDGRLVGEDRPFAAVSTDTRTLRSGELFFALRGERFDAAAFLGEAARRGAAGAVVAAHPDRHEPAPDADELPRIEVADTRHALGALARDWRARFELPVIGVTGSNGKTTVKEMTAAILRAQFEVVAGADPAADDDASRVLVTRGNLNNEIGLPLTVLRLSDRHRVAVFEMGAAKPGDIEYLVDIAAPTIGVVTNAGAAHLAGFGSEEMVAATKGEMFAGLGSGDVAVINHDDKYAPLWRTLAEPAAVVTFGLTAGATFMATDVRATASGDAAALEFVLDGPCGAVDIRLPMAGRHNVANALAAAAAAHAAGAATAAIRVGLAAAHNVAGRLLALPGVGGMTLYDDSYNANPVSVAAAIDFLADRDGETWLALGDMAELGPDSAALHRSIGARARRSGIDRLMCIGDHAGDTVAGYGAEAAAFDDLDALTDAIRGAAHPGVTLLVKGSRCMRLERLVAALRVEAKSASGEG